MKFFNTNFVVANGSQLAKSTKIHRLQELPRKREGVREGE